MNATSYVLFPLGKKRFALPSALVPEMARPDRLYAFPHTTPLLTGVLVRQGLVVPVCDIANVLVGPDAPPRKFYLIAIRSFGDTIEWTAIPVVGECELVNAEPLPRTAGLPDYVTNLLSLTSGEVVEVVDLGRVIAAGTAGSDA